MAVSTERLCFKERTRTNGLYDGRQTDGRTVDDFHPPPVLTMYPVTQFESQGRRSIGLDLDGHEDHQNLDRGRYLPATALVWQDYNDEE